MVVISSTSYECATIDIRPSPRLTGINSLDMTTISNDPSSWPQIKMFRFYSYFVVASFTAIIYDWALTFGQEIELVWRKHWSLMTILYLSLRCAGIIFLVVTMLWTLPSVSLTDTSCTILYYFQSGTSVVVNAMLGVIMIARLYAMYQRSRKMLVFLVVFFFAVNITCAVIAASSRVSGVETVLSGTYQCGFTGGNQRLITDTWFLTTAWEVITLCLAVWIVAKYLRELQQPSARPTLGNYFRVLIETHVFYFVAYATVACLNLGSLSPNIENSSSLGVDIYNGILQIAQAVQMFVLGPRLILSVRKCHAKANSDEGIDLSTIAFQELAHKPTGSSL
ncbi:hypothetical protein EV702DRAFT_1151124 [Suillus placidus]|uniref:DUF6533 domain-containing protein n=1 Tax=Suillus placidus TaxID=48579 RepID=A0A9P7CVK1_9AGAM|nr:hypothetical protein EV702DRAFT_1151124 [Suillus placidus]